MTDPEIEVTERGMYTAVEVFDMLRRLSEVRDMCAVEITYRMDGGDQITVGYGEAGEPAIIKVAP